MSRSHWLSRNPCSELNQSVSRIYTYFFNIHSNISSNLRLGLPSGLFPVGLPIKILKELYFSILTHLNRLYLI